MDVERFVAELPELFEDFPHSSHPRGRRFEDVIHGIPNLAEENVLALLNLAASLLGRGESYVEVGAYYGASLLGAMRGNEGDFVAVEQFSFGTLEVKGRTLPAASREGLEENLRRFGAEGATILEGEQVARATHDYLDQQPKARLLFDLPGADKGSPQWWEGVAVLGWRA